MLAGPAALAVPGWTAPGEVRDFGRWQTRTSQCSWQRAPSRLRQPCRGLRLEQNLEGFLSVRFLADGQGESVALEQLVFAGSLESNRGAMRCSDDGRCSPRWPARLVVATVADASFDSRGLAMGLPRSHLASGHCMLERRRVVCEARGQRGAIWAAEAEL